MKEYIERYAMIKELCGVCLDEYCDTPCDPSDCFIIRVINEQPAADVVEVVRCKDCQHGKLVDTTLPGFRYYRPECIMCECEEVVGDEPMVYFPTHFCSYGVRKDV